MTPRRERWLVFRARYDQSAPLDAAQFAELVEQIRTEPDAVLQRSYVVHLGRIAREVVTDEQLMSLGAMFTGKVPAYVANALIVRRLRRDPRDQVAIAAALASDRAFVHAAVAACELTAAQRDQLEARAPKRLS
ncbi:MAG: hypothetical protein JWO36_3246 [Myxococcales bacterium]|nr:hypothetical protein [Myxococcales bacterium]